MLNVGKWAADASWLEAGAPGNPYPVSVLDIAPFTMTRTSTSEDAGIREKFRASRRAQAGEHRPMPDDCVFINPRDAVGQDLSYLLPFAEARLGKGVKPEAMAHAMNVKVGPVRLARGMEDKWDLFQVCGCVRVLCMRTGKLIVERVCRRACQQIVVWKASQVML